MSTNPAWRFSDVEVYRGTYPQLDQVLPFVCLLRVYSTKLDCNPLGVCDIDESWKLYVIVGMDLVVQEDVCRDRAAKALMNAKVYELKVGDISIVRDFVDVFPEDLSGLPPQRQKGDASENKTSKSSNVPMTIQFKCEGQDNGLSSSETFQVENTPCSAEMLPVTWTSTNGTDGR
ncbi:hypothetical protein Tco_0058275 [Tanacetum coccineum]